MATPTYSIKALKVEKLAVDLEVKSSLDDLVYCWPSLAVRVLADGPGSPLASLDLSTREGVGAAVEIWVDRVEILATRKSIAQYRVCAKKPGLTDKLKKGMTWSSSAQHVDDHRYGPGALAAGGKLAAVVVMPGSVVPCGAVELLAVTKKGPGATKGWLNHVGVVGVGALFAHIITWSADRVKIWSDAQELLEEHAANVTCACLTTKGLAIGTPDGLLLQGERIDVGEVRALAWSDGLLHVLTAAGELIVFAGLTEQRRLKIETGYQLAVSGDQIAVAGDDNQVRWYRGDSLYGTVEQSINEARLIHSVALVPGGFAIAGLNETYLLYEDGRQLELKPSIGQTDISAAAGIVMATAYGDVVRARIWREAGDFIGEVLLPPSRLHRSGLPPRPPSTRLTPDGAWVLCPEGVNTNGTMRLIGTRGQGYVCFPNPLPPYDYLTDVEAIGSDSFLAGYGNHNALLWNLDGTSRDLGVRIDSIWYANGRLLTSKDNVVTEWDAELTPGRTFTVDVPWGLHWLEASGDGRFVVVGAQPRSWVRDMETGDQWEVIQPGGVNQPMFAGHPRYLVTNEMNGEKKIVRIWDVSRRAVLAELEAPSYCHRCQWLSGDRLLVASVSGVWIADLQGKSLPLLELPPVVEGRDRVVSLGFDPKGRLLTQGARSHLYAWPEPISHKKRGYGVHYGPSIFQHEAEFVIALKTWPAVAMRFPP